MFMVTELSPPGFERLLELMLAQDVVGVGVRVLVGAEVLDGVNVKVGVLVSVGVLVGVQVDVFV